MLSVSCVPCAASCLCGKAVGWLPAAPHAAAAAALGRSVPTHAAAAAAAGAPACAPARAGTGAPRLWLRGSPWSRLAAAAEAPTDAYGSAEQPPPPPTVPPLQQPPPAAGALASALSAAYPARAPPGPALALPGPAPPAAGGEEHGAEHGSTVRPAPSLCPHAAAAGLAAAAAATAAAATTALHRRRPYCRRPSTPSNLGRRGLPANSCGRWPTAAAVWYVSCAGAVHSSSSGRRRSSSSSTRRGGG